MSSSKRKEHKLAWKPIYKGEAVKIDTSEDLKKYIDAFIGVMTKVHGLVSPEQKEAHKELSRTLPELQKLSAILAQCKHHSLISLGIDEKHIPDLSGTFAKRDLPFIREWAKETCDSKVIKKIISDATQLVEESRAKEEKEAKEAKERERLVAEEETRKEKEKAERRTESSRRRDEEEKRLIAEHEKVAHEAFIKRKSAYLEKVLKQQKAGVHEKKTEPDLVAIFAEGLSKYKSKRHEIAANKTLQTLDSYKSDETSPRFQKQVELLLSLFLIKKNQHLKNYKESYAKLFKTEDFQDYLNGKIKNVKFRSDFSRIMGIILKIVANKYDDSVLGKGMKNKILAEVGKLQDKYNLDPKLLEREVKPEPAAHRLTD